MLLAIDHYTLQLGVNHSRRQVENKIVLPMYENARARAVCFVMGLLFNYAFVLNTGCSHGDCQESVHSRRVTIE